MYTLLYMANFIRKQVYLEPKQERRLKQRAKLEGVPEAEIIRRAIDRGLNQLSVSNSRAQAPTDRIPRFFSLIDELIRQGPIAGKRTWTRDELYDRKPK